MFGSISRKVREMSWSWVLTIVIMAFGLAMGALMYLLGEGTLEDPLVYGPPLTALLASAFWRVLNPARPADHRDMARPDSETERNVLDILCGNGLGQFAASFAFVVGISLALDLFTTFMEWSAATVSTIATALWHAGPAAAYTLPGLLVLVLAVLLVFVWRRGSVRIGNRDEEIRRLTEELKAEVEAHATTKESCESWKNGFNSERKKARDMEQRLQNDAAEKFARIVVLTRKPRGQRRPATATARREAVVHRDASNSFEELVTDEQSRLRFLEHAEEQVDLEQVRERRAQKQREEAAPAQP